MANIGTVTETDFQAQVLDSDTPVLVASRRGCTILTSTQATT